MRLSICILLIVIVNYSTVEAQTNKFVIVQLEVESKGTMHKYETDYWIISLEKWRAYDSNSVVPFYLLGYSRGDLGECVNKDTITFFNTMEEGVLELETKDKLIQQNLLSIIRDNKQKVMTVKKTWDSKFNESTKVYLTPVIGEIKYCFTKHSKKNELPLSMKIIGIPMSSFAYDHSFWSSAVFQEIKKFDYSKLEIILLDKMQ